MIFRRVGDENRRVLARGWRYYSASRSIAFNGGKRQVGNNTRTAEIFGKMATATGGDARKLESADALLDVVCMQALEQVCLHALDFTTTIHMLTALHIPKHPLPSPSRINMQLRPYASRSADTFLQSRRRWQVGGSALVDQYRAKYMAYTFAS
jgi:hypothetical protein